MEDAVLEATFFILNPYHEKMTQGYMHFTFTIIQNSFELPFNW